MQGRIYFGIVEDRDDFSQLGRCKVRVAGMHTHDKSMLPTSDLPWAMVMHPVGGNRVIAPVEGSEVIVMFADEPDCQLPVIMGTVNTLPQQKSVWIDQIPGQPRVRDITDPDVGHQWSRNPTENALSKSEEIRTEGPTDADKARANEIVNNADGSASKSTQVIGSSDATPTAKGQSTKASAVAQQVGNANPSTAEQLVVSQINAGSVNKVVSEYAERLKGLIGSDVALKIVKGETSLSTEIGKLKSNVKQATEDLGKNLVDNVVGDVLNKIDDFKELGGIGSSIKDAVNGNFDPKKLLNSLVGDEKGSILGNMGNSIGGISDSVGALSNALDGGLSFDNLKDGFEALGGIIDGVSGLGNGISSIVAGEEGLSGMLSGLTIDNIGDKLGGMFDGLGDKLGGLFDGEGGGLFGEDGALSGAVSQVGDVLSSAFGKVGEMYDKVSGVVSDLMENGMEAESVQKLIQKFTGPGGQSLMSMASGAVLQGLQSVYDKITQQLRHLLEYGLKPFEFVDGCLEKLTKFVDQAGKVMQAAAVAIMKENWDPSYITEPIRATINGWRAQLFKAMAFVVRGGNKVIDYISQQLIRIGLVVFDIFNTGVGVIKPIFEAIPFANVLGGIIANLVSKFFGGGSDNNEVGVGAEAVVDSINSGSYSSNAFKKSGDRQNIDKIGASKLTNANICGVGEGNTPAAYGINGGPNFKGGTMTEKTPSAVNRATNPSMANRALNATLPNIPLTIYGATDKAKVQANIKTIASVIPSMLATVEAQAAFMAISFAYCHCIPAIHDYEYTEKNQLLTKFPRSFKNMSSSGINNFLFARSNKKKSAEQFYNFVYDTANDGQTLGNITLSDGYTYAEAGLLPIVGRNAYTKWGAGTAASIASNVQKAAQVAMLQFLSAVQTAPMGSINVFYQALNAYPNVDKAVAKQAFEHFYGAKLFESYGMTEKTAGKQFDRATYYGSAQETPADTGYIDPNGKYPYARDHMKSSINPLARGDSVNTIVSYKESTRKLGIPVGGSQLTWDQPHSGYNAVYPYNNVEETESGHVIELDDTPGAERIHIYHRKGTFTEINADGTKTTRVVGDNYEIIDRNGFISIAGQANLTVTGSINIRCMSDANIEVDGSTDLQTHGSLNLGAANDVNISAGGSVNIWGNKGLNAQCNDNMHIRSIGGSVFATGKDIVSVYSEGTLYLSAEDDLFGNATRNVSFEAEEGTMDIMGLETTSVTSMNGSLQLYGGANACLSGARNVDITAAIGLHMQCLLNMSILSTGWCRIQSTAMDISSLSYMHLSALAEASLSAMGAVTVTAVGALQLGATGLVNINSGAALTMGAVGAASIQAKGVVGIDGLIVGLNSGMSLPSIPVISIPSLPAGTATKATAASGAPAGEKAVMYGMVTLAPRSPAYPDLPPLTTQSPVLRGEQVIETIDELHTADGQLIQKNMIMDAVQYDPTSSETTQIFANDVQPVDGKYDQVLIGVTQPNANTQLSDHFSLGDFFDGGFNKKHVLQDQCGLTKSQLIMNMAGVATNILEKIIDILPGGYGGYRKQWFITSGYRSTINNKSTGGSKVSQHMKGQAVDIQLAGGNKKKHYEMIQQIARIVPYDQLILEYSPNGRTAWIHCSFDKERQRQQQLTIDLYKGRTTNGFTLYS